MEGDAPYRRERAVVERDSVGQRNAEVRGDEVQVGMHSAVSASAGDAVADGEVTHAVANLEDDSRARVADSGRLVEAHAYGSDGLSGAVSTQLLDDLPRVFRPSACLADQRLLGSCRSRALGPDTEQARPNIDEDRLGRHGRGRNLEDRDPSVSKSLGDLFHPGPACALPARCNRSVPPAQPGVGRVLLISFSDCG